jgi:hypothetical protein
LNTTCEEDVPVHEWNCEFLTKRNFAANKKRQKKAFKPLSTRIQFGLMREIY